VNGRGSAAIFHELVVILALIGANALFAAAEIAIVAVRRTRLTTLVEDGRSSARAVQRLRDEPERFLATVQVGITVVSATAAAFGGAAVAGRLAPGIARIAPLAPYAEQVALGLVVALVSFLSIVLGELVPKSVAMRSPEPIALAAGRPLLALSSVARPIVWLLTATSNVLLRPFGDRTNFTESRLSPEELEQLVEEAGKTGELDASTAEIATRALAFRDLRASDVMVPRNRIVALPIDASQEELRRVLLEEGRARMPVYEETLDGIAGYVMAKDFAALAWERELILLPDLLRPVLFVPETAPAVRVLREMQQRRTQLAIVVDEHGGVAGLLTLEDLVEELVGEVFSEGEQPEPLVRRDPSGAAVVRGDTPIRDVNRELAIDLPEGEDYTTIAGLCIALAGAVPERGARLDTGRGVTLEVADASPRAVRAVRVHVARPSPAQDDGDPSPT
jgi:putative hemolysin